MYEPGGVGALLEQGCRKPNHKNRISESAISIALENPSFCQMRASDELRKHGVYISSGGVRCVWLRNNLETFSAWTCHVIRTVDCN